MVKNLPANAGDARDASLIRGLGRSPRGGHGNPLQYSCLENPMDGGVWWATVHEATKGWTRLKQPSTHAKNILSPSKTMLTCDKYETSNKNTMLMKNSQEHFYRGSGAEPWRVSSFLGGRIGVGEKSHQMQN